MWGYENIERIQAYKSILFVTLIKVNFIESCIQRRLCSYILHLIIQLRPLNAVRLLRNQQETDFFFFIASQCYISLISCSPRMNQNEQLSLYYSKLIRLSQNKQYCNKKTQAGSYVPFKAVLWCSLHHTGSKVHC